MLYYTGGWVGKDVPLLENGISLGEKKSSRS